MCLTSLIIINGNQFEELKKELVRRKGKLDSDAVFFSCLNKPLYLRYFFLRN